MVNYTAQPNIDLILGDICKHQGAAFKMWGIEITSKIRLMLLRYLGSVVQQILHHSLISHLVTPSWQYQETSYHILISGDLMPQDLLTPLISRLVDWLVDWFIDWFIHSLILSFFRSFFLSTGAEFLAPMQVHPRAEHRLVHTKFTDQRCCLELSGAVLYVTDIISKNSSQMNSTVCNICWSLSFKNSL